MPEPQSLRLSDVRAVFRLIGECRELWYDAYVWRTHLLQGAARLARGREAHWMQCHPSDSTAIDKASWGWDNHKERDTFRSLIARPVTDVLPELPQYLDRLSGQRFRSFRVNDVLPRRAWLMSECFNEYLRLANYDANVNSTWINPRTQSLEFVGVSRPLGDRQFSMRERRILELLHMELAPLVGTKLATENQAGVHCLTRRERQTLEGLLAGKSEKQIALDLRLSPTTVHDYVRSLHRQFGVTSRGELLSYFVNRTPAARPKPGGRSRQR